MTFDCYLKSFRPYINHFLKVVLLSEIQGQKGSEVLMDKHWRKRIINQQRVKRGLLVPDVEKRLFANRTILNMRKQNIRAFWMNVPP